MEPKPPSRPSEAEAGIHEFLQPEVRGFSCRFKERWQDFHVHEVDLSGNVLRLSELVTPGAVAEEMRVLSMARREARAALGPAFDPEPEMEAELKEALGDASVAQLFAFLRQQRPCLGRGKDVDGDLAASPRPDPPGFVDLESELWKQSKEARKRSHQVILKYFNATLSTETLELEGGGRQIRVWMRDAEKKVKSLPTTDSAKGVKAGGKNDGKGKKGKKGGKGKGKAVRETVDGAGEQGGAPSCQGFGTLRREGWPKGQPEYLYFRLYKENIDTAEAVAGIARCVGRSAKTFTTAGTKDRRAATVQQVCAHKLPADQLRRTVLHRFWDKRLRISDLEYRSERLRLGALSGNRFDIALRNVPSEAVAEDASATGDSKSSVVERAFAAVAAGGFLNFYGLQRFGTREVRTHRVGGALIAGRWTEAVRLIMGDVQLAVSGQAPKRPAQTSEEPPSKRARQEVGTSAQENSPEVARCSETEDSCGVKANVEVAADTSLPADAAPEQSAVAPGGGGHRNESPATRPRWQLVREAQKMFLEKGDANLALEAMPRNQHLERCLLGGLVRGLSQAETLRQLPHQALALYAHAAQSLVWNAVLSRRVKEFGRRAVVGDFVFAADCPETAGEPVTLDDTNELLMEVDEEEAELEEHETRLPAVRELKTLEEAAAVDFCDVVLPLPGRNVSYPSLLRAVYVEVSATLGLDLEDFHSSTIVPLTGAYRRAAVRPVGLEWRAVPPGPEQHAPLICSDVASLLDARTAAGGWSGPSKVSGTADDAAAPSRVETVSAEDNNPGVPLPDVSVEPVASISDNSVAEDGRWAVVFSCILPSSAYLTMLLREVMKESTELAHIHV